MLTLAMLIAAFPLYAADSQITTNGGSASTTITYTVPETYTVIIPESATISLNAGDIDDGSGTIIVSAQDVLLYEDETLSVSVTASQNYSGGFRLKTGTHTYLSYTIAGESNVALNTPFFSINAGTTSGSVTLTLTPSTATVAGTYTDTLTFTVNVG